MRFPALALACLVLSACEAPPASTAPEPEPTSASSVPAFPSGSQEARSAHCTERLTHYRDLGVWVHGGVIPGVRRSAWDELDEAEQDEVFLIAACLATAGMPGERIVTVEEEGRVREIDTRRVTVPE